MTLLTTNPNQIGSPRQIITEQKSFFATGKTRSIQFRLEKLKLLKQAIIEHQTEIIAALKADLNKPEFESIFEIAVIQDIDYTIKNLKKWAKPQKVKIPLTQFPGIAFIQPEPLGNVLIIGPWNYPFSLVISPLIGAIAAGNCALIKPSENAPQTSAIVTKIIRKIFDSEYIAVIEGGIEASQQLLQENYDHIFFTGGTKIGKIIMEAAAKNLTPVTLELGGKSPCIVDDNIDLNETAKRITWGKFINAGQTCIAPDYLLVKSNIKSELIEAMKSCLKQFYGDDPLKSPDYGRIINQQQFNRLTGLLQDVHIITGGQYQAEEKYLAPTLVELISGGHPLMEEEIFGPILPILEYQDLGEVISLINSKPKPLALYFFSSDRSKQELILNSTSSGGVCFNDTIMQVGIPDLPFGGVGESGIGCYHGKWSFDTFSHHKSVLKKRFRFDLNWRYAPYQDKVEQVKKMFGK
jgi:acyl-CoA reductase-like NAD-dependent aldehyde dehydrogenase